MEVRSTVAVVALAALVLLGLGGAVVVAYPYLAPPHLTSAPVEVVVEFPDPRDAGGDIAGSGVR